MPGDLVFQCPVQFLCSYIFSWCGSISSGVAVQFLYPFSYGILAYSLAGRCRGALVGSCRNGIRTSATSGRELLRSSRGEQRAVQCCWCGRNEPLAIRGTSYSQLARALLAFLLSYHASCVFLYSASVSRLRSRSSLCLVHGGLLYFSGGSSHHWGR